MKQTCCICGAEDDESFMERIQSSRVQWLCIRCYRLGVREVALSEAMKKRKKINKHREEKK